MATGNGFSQSDPNAFIDPNQAFDINRQTFAESNDMIGNNEIISRDELLDKPFVDDPFENPKTLKPNVQYRSGEFGYQYATDPKGRIFYARAEDLQLTSRKKRLYHVRNTPGKRVGDHAGHLFGDQFGGSNRLDNLVSQLEGVNLSKYKKIENYWKKSKRGGKTVRADMRIVYDGESTRPKKFLVRYEIDGVVTVQQISNE